MVEPEKQVRWAGFASLRSASSSSATCWCTITACPDTVPHPQRLSVLAEALPEVEAGLGI
ncbi:hypothetical protein [Nocardia tenerifensis]|uniref:hypothetical protein n=1 Tax=Nocardia tenerifensis TaxID=228006 RepID=UPI0002E332B5|nr:hypothetical protein [Nocardia tenerifensis]